MGKKIGDKSCLSKFEKRSSGFGSFLSYLITAVIFSRDSLLTFQSNSGLKINQNFLSQCTELSCLLVSVRLWKFKDGGS
jgi:hypothetical protein